METTYKIEDGKILKITTEISLEKLKDDLEKDSKFGYSNILDQIRFKVSEEASKAFIREHLHDVVAAIKPQEVANMATLSTMERITGNR